MTKHNKDEADRQPPAAAPLGRRSFIGHAGALAVGTAVAVGFETHPTKVRAQDDEDDAPEPSGSEPSAPNESNYAGDQDVVARNYRVRRARARANRDEGTPHHPNNGDDELYPTRIGSDTRGLPHNELGEVDGAAYDALLHALDTRNPDDFELVPLGGTRKLTNPLGGLAVNLSGLATVQRAVPVAPTLASAERAAEAVEVYWQSLLRDVPFSEYRNDTNNELILAAVSELNKLSGYTGPRDASGQVTPEVLFRGTARYPDPNDPSGRGFISIVPPGVATGPYLSQFLLRDVPYGTTFVTGQIRPQLPVAENAFGVSYDEWLALQDGRPTERKISFDPVRRYPTTGRDLAEYARGGAPTYWAAALLLSTAVSTDPLVVGGFGAPSNPANPYLQLKSTASGTGTWGTPYVQSLLPFATSRGQRSIYFQKWFVHRTIRPEAFGGLLHNHLAQGADYPLHEDILLSEAVNRSYQLHGTYLFPLATPDGAPNHGSYPGGASENTAINTTLLKAFYDENYVIPDPVQPDPSDPTKLIPYVGPPLTIGGELNKLATNLGQGRNWLGVHWRSDAAVSLPHAEEIGFGILRDERPSFVERFDGFQLSRYDGTLITI
ncbi:MAG: twin-arginine translocation pathway signal protein, partial [Polyangiales bacterium]